MKKQLYLISSVLFLFISNIHVTAQTGEALAFSGSHTLSIPHSTVFNLTSALTLEAWVKTVSSSEAYIITKNDDSWYLAINGAGGASGKASFYLNGVTPSGWLYGTTTISDGNWHHLAATYNGSRMFLFVDGNLEAQAAATGAVQTGTNTIRLGSRSNASPFNFTGTMDEIRIWSTARSQCEVQRYMNCEIATTATSLTVNYHFTQGIAGGTNTAVTTLTSSAGGNTGTLSNFVLTGTVSNWVAPGAVVSSYTTVSSNTPTITLRGNSVIITDGSISTSASNFTDFGALFTRTFVINNAAGNTLTIGKPYITGANATEFSVTTVPSASISPGGTNSFVVTFNPSAVGTRTATINFVTNDCSSPVFDFVVSGTSVAGAALKFDGTNDYISRTETNFGTGDFCIELWVKPTSFSAPNGDIYLVTNRSNDFSGSGNWYVLGIESTGQLKFNMGVANLAGGMNLYSPTNLSLNVWQHVAVARTGTLVSLYLNGLLMASGTDIGARDLNAGYNIVTFGAWGSPLGQRYFTGEMDEVRLWNTSRSQCQIQSYMRCEIPTTSANLIGNYHFNQGVASGNNTSLSNLSDVSASSINGTFNSIALNGANSNFVSVGGVTTGSNTPVSLTSSIAVTGNGNVVTYGATTTGTANFTNFNGASTRTFVINNTGTATLNVGTPFFTGANASEFSLTVLPGTSITTGTTSFVISFLPTSLGTKSATVNFFNNDCSKAVFNFVIQATGVSGSALNFSNASADVISVPNVTLNNQSFTIEFWAKRSNISDENYVVGQGSTSSNNGLNIGFRTNNTFNFSFFTSSLTVSNAACTDGLYHHWACVYKSGSAGLNRLIYLDGILIASDNSSNYTGNGNFYIGNSIFGSSDNFNGAIDEFRIWNVARSQCDIQSYMNCEIATTASSLIANYHFNQGVDAGVNTTVTTLTDATGSGHTGTLTSFMLTGATSNWINAGGVSSGSVIPASVTASITVTGNGNGITQGSTVPLATNFTSFGSVATRTFVLDNTGGGILNINALYFTGANAAQFSMVSTLSSLTTGTLALVISYIPSSAGTQSATVNILTNDCGKPVFNFDISATATLAAALKLDGANDFLSRAALSTQTTDVTMQARVYVSALTATNQVILYNGNTGTNGYGFHVTATGQVQIVFGGTGISATGYTLPLNQWVSLALVIESGGTLRFYANGLQVYSQSAGLSTSPTGSFLVGANNAGGEILNGSVDEILFWTRALSQCEIQTNSTSEIPNSASSLIANYHFNQGFASADNPTVTSATDASGNGNNITLNNFALTGTSSNWIAPGAVVSGYTVVTVPLAEIGILGNGTVISDGAVTTSLADNTNFGGLCVSASLAKTFTIQNTGSDPLLVASVILAAGSSSAFAISGSSATIAPGGSTTFSVTLTSVNAGVVNATVNVTSSDCDEALYNFPLTGTLNSVPLISTSNGTICQGQSYTIIATGANTYTYSSGPVVSPLNTTSYSITGTNAAGCVSSNTAVIQVSVNTTPTISILGSNTLCAGGFENYTVSGANTYTWSTGATSTLVTLNPSVTTTYSVTGTYTNGCDNAALQSITVYSLPTITIADASICPGNSYTLTPSGALSYSFSSGSAVIFPAITNTYAVLGTSSLGCVASASVIATVSVINTVTVSVSGNTLICEGQTASLTANGATSYSWTNSALTSSVTLSPTVTTTYTVFGANGTCSNTAVISVSVNSVPVLSVNSGVICAGDSFTMVPGGATSYTYSNGSNVASPLVNTSYSVTGANAAGCVSTISAIANVTVNALPIISIAASSASACVGSAITLTVSGANSYEWSNSLNTTTLNTSVISVTPVAGVTYSTAGTDLNGCVGTFVHVLAVNPLPTITVVSGTICESGSFTIIPQGAATYTVEGGISIVSPTTTATYTVGGTDVAGCSNTAICTVIVSALPTITVNNGTICQGDSFTISPGGASTYTVQGGALVVSPASNITYTVNGTNTAGCVSSNTASSSIVVNALPSVSVSTTNSILCSEESATLSAQGATSYTFYPGGPGTNLSISPAATTTYTLVGSNATGCSNTVVFTQVVDACTGIYAQAVAHNFFKVYPNPAKENINLELDSEYQITILNSIGQIVYFSKLHSGNHQINIWNLAKGIYVIQLNNAVHSKNIKMIKE